MENQDDMESLLAQIEQGYAEQEKKKTKKKGGKGGKNDEDVVAPAQVEATIVDQPKDQGDESAAAKKDNQKKANKNNKKTTAETKKEKPEEETTKTTNPPDQADSNKTESSSASSKKNKKKETKEVLKAPTEEASTAISEPATQTKTESASTSKKSGKDAKSGDKTGAKKKPAAGIALLKEALEKTKQQEEEQQRLEEEKLRKEEEAKQKRLEQERLEKERKEKKKQKEKERIAKLKKEGKYETKEQKEARKRALLQIQALGARIPLKETNVEQKEESVAAATENEKTTNNLKKPVYERLRKKQQQESIDSSNKQTDQDKQQQQVDSAADDDDDQVKDNWEVVEEEVVKDEWDADSDSNDKATKAASVTSSKKSKSTTKSSTTATSGVSSSTFATTKKNENNGGGGVGSDDEDGSAGLDSGDNEDDDDDLEEEETDSEIEDEKGEDVNLPPMERVRIRLQKRHEEAERTRSVDNLRAPVICVLGHVDTGKTKILDNLRRTRVQEDEAGGITQQIGATNVPLDTVKERTKMCRHIYKEKIKIPGFLIIDTPGHESFKSLRTRGSSLCDIAILVIDIMHGLEPQTIESINILKERKTPFLVALNKIDRLFDWKKNPDTDVIQVLESQPENTKREFEKRSAEIIVQLAEQGLNASLYYKNPDVKTYISMVPTSAHTSDGIGNLMALITEFTQTILAKRVSYSRELQCTVMEVKAIPGLGTTIDVCLVNGKLKVCDTIVIPGQEGPIVTQIRGLLLPQPNRELRVKNSYTMNKEVVGAQGVKIAGKELEKAMAGLPLFVARKEDEIDFFKEELQVMLKQALSSIKLSDTGVFVQASTLGSLEALLEFLRTSKIPYAGISIGPVHKKDITMASIMLEKDPQYAVILAFDVKVERDAQDMADHVGVKVFTADIIYHLFDKFTGYRDELKQKKREEFKDIAVFPFKLKIMPEFIFNTRDPIIVGVKIESGFVKIGSPVCAMCEVESTEREGKEKFVDLGRISSIEYNHKPLEVAKQGQEVCIKIDNTTGGAPKLLGRHFLQSDYLVSKISRESIDAVKNYFREEMTKSDWQLIIELKKQFQIL